MGIAITAETTSQLQSEEELEIPVDAVVELACVGEIKNTAKLSQLELGIG